MPLNFSHVDVLFNDVSAPVEFHRKALGFRATPVESWQRGEFHVESVTLYNGNHRLIFVRPISGILRGLLDRKGDGFTYRIAYTTPNLSDVYKDLVRQGIQPENENGERLAFENLRSPAGVDILWMPKTFGDLSIELIEEDGWSEYIARQEMTAI